MAINLKFVLQKARESGEEDEMYIRGQVALITDVFDLGADRVVYDTLTEIITSVISLETGTALLTASARRIKELKESEEKKDREKEAGKLVRDVGRKPDAQN